MIDKKLNTRHQHSIAKSMAKVLYLRIRILLNSSSKLNFWNTLFLHYSIAQN